jgi:hypothetical protein
MKGSKMNENFDLPDGKDVYWEKWVDVYEEEIKDFKDLEKELSAELGEGVFSNESDEEGFPGLDAMEAFPAVRTILTPFGVLPITEETLASKYFKFWVGHTNFKLLNRYIETVGLIEGVETIDVLTPYRFRISIGKLFKDRDVMVEIRKRLLELL